MRFSLGATALAAAVLFTSAAWGQVGSFEYSESDGRGAWVKLNTICCCGPRARSMEWAISQHGDPADATAEVRAARVNTNADAVTAGGRVTAVSRTVRRGNSGLYEALARARRGSEATADATGVVQRARQTGEVLQRVEAQAIDGGRSVSSGNAYDLD